MTTATATELQRIEGERFLARVKNEHPQVMELGYAAVIAATVEGMRQLGLDSSSLDESKYWAGFQHALSTEFGAQPIKSAAEKECDAVVAENYNQAQIDAVNHWLQNQTLLENSGDMGWENASTLLKELIGHSISRDSILAAIGRIEAPATKFHVRRRQLHYAPQAKKTSLYGRYSAEEGHKPGSFVSDANLTPLQHRQKQNEAQAANSPQPVAEVLSDTDARWRQMAQKSVENYRGHFHSDTETVREAHNNAIAQGLEWRRVYEITEKSIADVRRRRTQSR
jgi:hypothetical protein